MQTEKFHRLKLVVPVFSYAQVLFRLSDDTSIEGYCMIGRMTGAIMRQFYCDTGPADTKDL